jgi:hypothetical protein
MRGGIRAMTMESSTYGKGAVRNRYNDVYLVPESEDHPPFGFETKAEGQGLTPRDISPNSEIYPPVSMTRLLTRDGFEEAWSNV